ncbi:M20 family metallopeptidase [Barrientosiimonas humi]|uniref:M20 family metallopeptidase n=1 Tax=Barrientosiimonas humi TaxID=999931 RepID=UPI00370D2A30
MSAQTAPPLTAVEQALLDRIDTDRIVAATQRLVRARGENPPGQEAETVATLAAVCRERDLDVRTETAEADRDNLLARTTGDAGGPALLLLGHTDVVPVGEGWTRDPFGGEVDGGRVFGRGTTDMKGGLAAAVEAMAAVQEHARATGRTLTGGVELAATVDEEQGGVGIRAWVAQQPAKAYVGCVTAEPTDLQTVIAARGDAYLDIRVHGTAAHSGRPDDGANAIYGAARIVTTLRDWHTELAAAPHPLAGPATWSVGIVEGGTGTSIVPAECRVLADRRLLPGEDAEQVLREVIARVDALGLERDGLRVEIDLPMWMPGFETAPDNAFVTAVESSLGTAGGPGLGLGGWTAACDGGFVARDLGVPVVVLGPGSVNEQAHRPDESVGVDELTVAARTYALAAWRLLAPDSTAGAAPDAPDGSALEFRSPGAGSKA